MRSASIPAGTISRTRSGSKERVLRDRARDRAARVHDSDAFDSARAERRIVDRDPGPRVARVGDERVRPRAYTTGLIKSIDAHDWGAFLEFAVHFDAGVGSVTELEQAAIVATATARTA